MGNNGRMVRKGWIKAKTKAPLELTPTPIAPWLAWSEYS